jgi:hypothetical protein
MSGMHIVAKTGIKMFLVVYEQGEKGEGVRRRMDEDG